MPIKINDHSMGLEIDTTVLSPQCATTRLTCDVVRLGQVLTQALVNI